LGESNISTACRVCHSSGWVGAKDCQECEGTGKSSVKRIRTIDVPSGTLTGMKTIFEGEGDEGMDGGPTGDLVLWYEVEGTPLAGVFLVSSISFTHKVRYRGKGRAQAW
jgi:molecular chaperone DnaJ